MPSDYISPRNSGQARLSKALKSDKPLLFATGRAGTGKTLLTISEALQAVFEEKKFGKGGKLIYTRLQEDVGKSLGFLPGSIDEKTAPYLRPFFTSLDTMNANGFKEFIDKRIFFEKIQTMRGDTWHNSFAVIDEAQNLDNFTMNTIGTRPADGSKLVLLGNFAQIDNPKLRSSAQNGFFNLLKGLYDGGHHDLFDHVHLDQVERSKMSSIVEGILMPDNVIGEEMVELELRGL
jgi:predicted ribonuclease YlaK